MGQRYFSHPIDKIKRLVLEKQYSEEFSDLFWKKTEELHML